ncbi:MAG TPA: 8-oxo-dGTP diphosphatase [Patescibacteria group bacterium]|nr:8-oxo-dGTP diphosphatase [Patescibacteria group bacterium]
MDIGTLCFLIRDERIVLAMKKQGFGKGKWNGYGGKIKDQDEGDINLTAIRETKEESDLEIRHARRNLRAIITFYFGGEPGFKVYVFLVYDWFGEPRETSEMKPKWFDLDQIPYNQMWVADKEWLPLILAGQRIKAEVFFDQFGKKLEKFDYQEMKS